MAKQTICVVGNPNCGKTTLFNALTGAHQDVGNWPGVTVEKKVGYYTYNNEQILSVMVAVTSPSRLMTFSATPATNW